MQCFKLDANHDLELLNGSFVTITGIEAVGQAIKTRLLFFKGEWFLDAREGVPYFSEILKKGPSFERVRSIIKQTIQNVPEIIDVPSVTVALDNATREMTITFSARYQDGTTVSFPPLLIEL